jgi:hypothetical protein
MVVCGWFSSAIIAVDESFRIGVLIRHRLNLDLAVQRTELRFHVRDTAGTDGAFVAIMAPVLEARFMDAVTTAHEYDGIAGCEHILPADGTVAFGRVFNTAVAFLDLNGHTGNAFLAVEEILAEAFAQPTDPAVVTVVYAFMGIIVPKFAYGAVVEGGVLAAHSAGLRDGLGRAA